jgi:hypothetical protein
MTDEATPHKWLWIERLPRPERNGWKGSILAVSLLLGLTFPPVESVYCRRVESVQTPRRRTALIFPSRVSSKGEENSACYLDVRSQANEIKTQEIDPRICTAGLEELNTWIEVGYFYCPSLPPSSSVTFSHCYTLVVNIGEAQEWYFNFDTPAAIRFRAKEVQDGE